MSGRSGMCGPCWPSRDSAMHTTACRAYSASVGVAWAVWAGCLCRRASPNKGRAGRLSRLLFSCILEHNPPQPQGHATHSISLPPAVRQAPGKLTLLSCILGQNLLKLVLHPAIQVAGAAARRLQASRWISKGGAQQRERAATSARGQACREGGRWLPTTKRACGELRCAPRHQVDSTDPPNQGLRLPAQLFARASSPLHRGPASTLERARPSDAHLGAVSNDSLPVVKKACAIVAQVPAHGRGGKEGRVRCVGR